MTARRPYRPIVQVAAGLIGLAALGAVLTLAWPAPAASLFPDGPRRTLAGTPVEVAEILGTNLAVLVMPLLFAGASGGRPGPWRLAGDLVTVAISAVNSLVVGAALALNGAELLPYLPHLPVEAMALALASSTWIRQRLDREPLGRPFATTVILAVAAALIEVYATPHVAS